MRVRARLLPLTVAAMTLLLGVKATALLHDLDPALTPRPAPLVAAAAAATPDPPQSDRADAPRVPAPMAGATGPANVASATTPLGAPPISDNERALLLELRQRRMQLDKRDAEIAARAKLLAASEHRLEARLDELTALQTRLQALEDARRQRDDANWSGLVKLYESMKPRDAAVIFNELDMTVLLPVVDRMKENKAAVILAAMEPAKARTLTTDLAQARLHANSIDPAKGG